MKKLRAPAIPLITVDPYFSIWSFADNLYDDATRHWTGSRQNMLGIITIDGVHYKFMGIINQDGLYAEEPKCLTQTDVTITPLRTIYTFENDNIVMNLEFMTPLLLDDLKLASRPISYITYKIRFKDSKKHEINMYLNVSSEMAVDIADQKVMVRKYKNGACCGRGYNDILSASGDNKRIEWGYLHIFSKEHCPIISDIISASSKYVTDIRGIREMDDFDADKEYRVADDFISIGVSKSFSIDDKAYSDFVCVAYDDIHSIMYFNKPIDAYYKKDGDSFEDVCNKALDEYESIRQRVRIFDEELISKAQSISPKYADILSLAYRQTVAAHKITWDGEEIQFFSKECFSNGCIATVDVTYPSIPLFLIYNPELVCGMLNPIFKYASSPAWEYEFAPHDIGQYPLANGQVYGLDKETGILKYESQMPIEECGNMIICVAATCYVKKDTAYAEKHLELIEKWANYLVNYGLDPENQLCTDDFAGHLAHNCNLSIKAIIAIACFGDLLKKMDAGIKGEKYIEIAKKYAKEWVKKAFDKNHYSLAFDLKDSWSIKYNLVWDKILNLNIFDDEVFKTETSYYIEQINKYGLPLDSRENYTKTDWQIWSTCLTEDPHYTNVIVESMWDMLNETQNRVPFSDWYCTLTADQIMFQNRTVQGGLFIRLM